jgi:hypothetical protein
MICKEQSYQADLQDDAIMSPLPGCEKPSVVRIIIHYTYKNSIEGQHMHLGVCTARVIQYATTSDQRTSSIRDKE